jgi:hypothetical protein
MHVGERMSCCRHSYRAASRIRPFYHWEISRLYLLDRTVNGRVSKPVWRKRFFASVRKRNPIRCYLWYFNSFGSLFVYVLSTCNLQLLRRLNSIKYSGASSGVRRLNGLLTDVSRISSALFIRKLIYLMQLLLYSKCMFSICSVSSLRVFTTLIVSASVRNHRSVSVCLSAMFVLLKLIGWLMYQQVSI